MTADRAPLIVCPMTEVALPVKAKRGDAFMAGSQMTALATANGWAHRTTYTRLRYPATDKKPARYVATMAVRFSRASIWPWRFERAVGYWRTNAAGKYGLAWAACWIVEGTRVLAPVAYLSAAGLKGLLALPVGTLTKDWPATIAPLRASPAPPEPDEDETDD